MPPGQLASDKQVLSDIWDFANHQIRVSGGTGSGTVNVNEIGGASVALGQTSSADSLPVVLPSDVGINLQPTAVGGWDAYFADAVTGVAVVSSSSGKFGGYMLMNLNSTPIYLQCFDTVGSVTLGSTPPTFVIPIPANGSASLGLAANLELANGIKLSNGLKIAATTTSKGNTTASTGVTGSIWYI